MSLEVVLSLNLYELNMNSNVIYEANLEQIWTAWRHLCYQYHQVQILKVQ